VSDFRRLTNCYDSVIYRILLNATHPYPLIGSIRALNHADDSTQLHNQHFKILVSRTLAFSPKGSYSLIYSRLPILTNVSRLDLPDIFTRIQYLIILTQGNSVVLFQ